MSFSFQIGSQCTKTSARTGWVSTPHNAFATPRFMPVGTWGTVRWLEHEDLESIGVPCILGNTYHLYLRPGHDVLRHFQGYHNLITWKGSILTDSGGFQIFSLPSQRVISEKGVDFRSYVDHSWKHISPEDNIAFQQLIGSDIMMVLDVCVPSTSSRSVAGEAMDRTHRWARRCLEAKTSHKQALFAIAQGALFEDLRAESAETLSSLPFDGFAIGGLAVGENEAERVHFTHYTAQRLPWNKPRYLMGVGTPTDLLESVRAGVDLFDCIIPTNHAKQGIAYTWEGKVKLRRLTNSRSEDPLSASCSCRVCRRYSRSYLHQMIKCDESTGARLVAFHNIWFYEELMKQTRTCIENGTFDEFSRKQLEIFRTQG